MNVLIIDDDAPWAELCRVILRDVANKIRVSPTYKDAVETIARPNGYDVVMLDLKLPDSTPKDTISRIKDIKISGRKVVLMTGAWPHDLNLTPENCGADGVLFKWDAELASKLKLACT